jgi:5'-3' exoribonuclease 1
MGILNFYKWFKERYSGSITNSIAVNIDNLYIDANGLVHDAAEIVYGKSRERLLIKSKTARQPRAVSEMHYKFVEYIENIIKIVNPKRAVYIFLDGVAPAAKLRQQKMRRLNLNVVDKFDYGFSSNQITAGTKFMDSFVAAVKPILEEIISRRNLSFMLDDPDNPGEGEHKLVAKLKTMPHNFVNCIIGVDADLIMLGLLIDAPTFIMRSHREYINLTLAKRMIEIPIRDFILLCSFVGNDFLLPIAGLEIKEGTMDLLCDCYHECRANANWKLLVAKDFTINLSVLKLLFETLCNTRLLPESQNLLNTDIGYNYVKGLHWILKYYGNGTCCDNSNGANWSWFYENNQSPFINQLVNDYTSVSFPHDLPPSKQQRLIEIMS